MVETIQIKAGVKVCHECVVYKTGQVINQKWGQSVFSKWHDNGQELSDSQYKITQKFCLKEGSASGSGKLMGQWHLGGPDLPILFLSIKSFLQVKEDESPTRRVASMKKN